MFGVGSDPPSALFPCDSLLSLSGHRLSHRGWGCDGATSRLVPTHIVSGPKLIHAGAPFALVNCLSDRGLAAKNPNTYSNSPQAGSASVFDWGGVGLRWSVVLSELSFFRRLLHSSVAGFNCFPWGSPTSGHSPAPATIASFTGRIARPPPP